MTSLVWLIPLFPLVGFVVLLIIGRRLGEPLAGWFATVMMGGSFVAAILVFAGLLAEDPEDRRVTFTLFEWIPVGDVSIDFSFLADPLSITMALFITGIGALIHLYSIGYMHGDENFSKYFVYLNLFAFSMLMLVLGGNLLVTFLGWEGVGACSYLLISFWFTDEANATAGKKAFLTNRVGDFGFMVAMFLVFFTFGSLNYGEVFAGVINDGIAETTATAIILLLFLGAAGKSAQFPLYLWLPDAMAGPTPVSALIHAATMVTAGVYLLVRVNPLIAEAAGWATDLIAWIGLFTALFAASIAVAQNDIKKVLAYSTVSQLGFMFVAVGTGAYVAAIFHMVTHAFFKALLFLGSGSVIHGMGGEQDMRRYGGLAKLMPITAVTMIIGWLAIAGVPPFAGFWSKDEILLGAFEEGSLLWILLLIAAGLTAYYMTRLVILTFFGEARWSTEGDDAVHPHESPMTMTVPLVVLAGLAVIGGFLNMPFTSWWHHLEHWLEPALFDSHEVTASAGTKWGLAIVAVVGGLIGLGAAVAVYVRGQVDPAKLEPTVLAKGWYYDETVTDFMGGPGRKGFEATTAFDETVIDGAVDRTGAAARRTGSWLRPLQNGLVRSYAVGIIAGAVALAAWFATRAGGF